MSRSSDNRIKCPKCGVQSKSTLNAFDSDNNEAYRQRVCRNPECGHIFFTIEFVVETNQELIDTWDKCRHQMNAKAN